MMTRLSSIVVMVIGVFVVLTAIPVAAQAVIGEKNREIYDNQEAFDLAAEACLYTRRYNFTRPLIDEQIDLKKAIALFERAIAAQPNARINAELARRIAESYGAHASNGMVQDWNKAREWYQRCSDLTAPTQLLWMDAQMFLATAHRVLGDHFSQFLCYRRILDVDIDNLELPNWRIAPTDNTDLTNAMADIRKHAEDLQASAANSILNSRLVLNSRLMRIPSRDMLLEAVQHLAVKHKGTPRGDQAAGMLAAMREAGTQPAATQPADAPPRWATDIAENFDAFQLLYRNSPTTKQASEITRWEAKELKETPEWHKNLQAVLDRHPRSPFADEAALWLARAHFLYKGDSKAAIDALYEVAKTYPDATCFADPPMIETLATIPEFLQPILDEQGTLRLPVYDRAWRTRTEEKIQKSEYQTMEVLDHLQEHPNKTADEAKYWIAWIIVKAELADRYDEAETLLRELSQLYAEENRPEKDAAAAKELENPLIAKLPRVETNARTLLVELKEKEFMSKNPKAEQLKPK